MTEKNDTPRPVEDLDRLAEYYDTHDTSAEMEHGRWVDPRPMRTTSLRLPDDLIATLKATAKANGLRYNAFVREVLQRAVSERTDVPAELGKISEQLERIEEAVTGHGG